MTTESILLIGRENGREVLRTHADRLTDRCDVGALEVATYDCEPIRELRDTFEKIEAETVYAVPMCVAHTYETLTDIPAALSYVPGTVRYCEPIGGSPAVTDVLAERASAVAPDDTESSLVLVGFGSSSKPYHRQTADYHAARLREQSGYEAVLTCYLLQNPTVECVRYNVTTSNAVAVPLFVAPGEATERRIPAALELDRGGIQYADPLGGHPRVTDAICGEVAKQRALANDETADRSFEARLTQSKQPVATDGEGASR